jgi:dTDP-glucose 4,6-dehydratase
MVTGGAGFIGSNFVRMVCKTHPDWSIVVYDALTYAGNLDNIAGLGDQVQFVRGDIADVETVQAAMAGCDGVINFAAESHVDRSLVDGRPFVKTNVEGTLVLLDAARKVDVKRFLHVSTDEVYGDLVGTDHHSLEGDVFKPRSPYAASKSAAEHLVFSYGISFGLDVVVTRGSNTYGPYQFPEKIIPLFITNAIEDKPLPIYGNGDAVRDYMHAEDHACGIDRVLHHGETGLAYNLGARVEINGREVATSILTTLGKPETLVEYVKDRPGHDYRYAVDPSAAESLGWTRKWNFKDGLAATCAWYVENEEWWRKIKRGDHFKAHEGTWYADREAQKA